MYVQICIYVVVIQDIQRVTILRKLDILHETIIAFINDPLFCTHVSAGENLRSRIIQSRRGWTWYLGRGWGVYSQERQAVVFVRRWGLVHGPSRGTLLCTLLDTLARSFAKRVPVHCSVTSPQLLRQYASAGSAHACLKLSWCRVWRPQHFGQEPDRSCGTARVARARWNPLTIR